MAFVAQVTTQDPKLPRIYVHSAGLRDSGMFMGPNHAQDAVRQFLDQYHHEAAGRILDGEFSIGCIWALTDDPSVCIDLFTWSDLQKWKGNPTLLFRVISTGTLYENGAMSCGDFLLASAIEERYRRKTKSMEEYLAKPAPVLPRQLREPDFTSYPLTF